MTHMPDPTERIDDKTREVAGQNLTHPRETSHPRRGGPGGVQPAERAARLRLG